MRLERDQRRTYAIVALVAAGFGLGGYLPSRWERAELRGRAEEAQRFLASDSSASVRSLGDKIAHLRLAARDAGGEIPATDELADVLRGLTESMNAFGAQVHEVNVGDVEHRADYRRIPLMMKFDGPFPATYGVLKQIEGMPRLIRVERLRVDGSVDNPAEPVQVELEVSTFYAPQKEDAKR